MMENTEGFGDNTFFATGPVFHHSSLLNSALEFGVDFAQIKQCSPHVHSSSACLLFWGLFSIRVWGIAACFGKVFSSAFSGLTKVGVGTSSVWGELAMMPLQQIS